MKSILQHRGFSLKVIIIIIINEHIKSLVARMKICCCFKLILSGEIGKKFYVVLEGRTAAFSRIKKIEKESLFKLAIMRMLFEIIR